MSCHATLVLLLDVFPAHIDIAMEKHHHDFISFAIVPVSNNTLFILYHVQKLMNTKYMSLHGNTEDFNECKMAVENMQ